MQSAPTRIEQSEPGSGLMVVKFEKTCVLEHKLLIGVVKVRLRRRQILKADVRSVWDCHALLGCPAERSRVRVVVSIRVVGRIGIEYCG
jgi:hypothetical protein